MQPRGTPLAISVVPSPCRRHNPWAGPVGLSGAPLWRYLSAQGPLAFPLLAARIGPRSRTHRKGPSMVAHDRGPGIHTRSRFAISKVERSRSTMDDSGKSLPGWLERPISRNPRAPLVCDGLSRGWPHFINDSPKSASRVVAGSQAAIRIRQGLELGGLDTLAKRSAAPPSRDPSNCDAAMLWIRLAQPRLPRSRSPSAKHVAPSCSNRVCVTPAQSTSYSRGPVERIGRLRGHGGRLE